MTTTPNLLEEAVRDLTAAPTNGLEKSRARDILREFALAVVRESVPIGWAEGDTSLKMSLANVRALLGLTDDKETL